VSGIRLLTTNVGKDAGVAAWKGRSTDWQAEAYPTQEDMGGVAGGEQLEGLA
jgi:hypothetical protein